MEHQLKALLFICIITSALTMPSKSTARERRDVMDSIKNVADDTAKTLSDAGDAVVHVFKPTEKSTLDKMADGVKSLAQ